MGFDSFFGFYFIFVRITEVFGIQSVVLQLETESDIIFGRLSLDLDKSLFSELERVGNKVHDDLFDPVGVVVNVDLLFVVVNEHDDSVFSELDLFLEHIDHLFENRT